MRCSTALCHGAAAANALCCWRSGRPGSPGDCWSATAACRPAGAHYSHHSWTSSTQQPAPSRAPGRDCSLRSHTRTALPSCTRGRHGRRRSLPALTELGRPAQGQPSVSQAVMHRRCLPLAPLLASTRQECATPSARLAAEVGNAAGGGRGDPAPRLGASLDNVAARALHLLRLRATHLHARPSARSARHNIRAFPGTAPALQLPATRMQVCL